MGERKDLRLMEGYYGISDLAAEMSVAPSTVMTWIKRGFVKPPKHKWRGSVNRYWTAAEMEVIQIWYLEYCRRYEAERDGRFYTTKKMEK
jgi:hypothetical protein